MPSNVIANCHQIPLFCLYIESYLPKNANINIDVAIVYLTLHTLLHYTLMCVLHQFWCLKVEASLQQTEAQSNFVCEPPSSSSQPSSVLPCGQDIRAPHAIPKLPNLPIEFLVTVWSPPHPHSAPPCTLVVLNCRAPTNIPLQPPSCPRLEGTLDIAMTIPMVMAYIDKSVTMMHMYIATTEAIGTHLALVLGYKQQY